MPPHSTAGGSSPVRQLVDKGRRSKWWRRLGSKARGFKYASWDGHRISDEASLERIRSRVIPPAWSHVRINPAAHGKVRAVGIDTTGRLQYIYDPKFVETRQRKKFARIEKFGEYMPVLRKVTNEHIALDGFPRDKVLAIMTRLMNSLYIRMGTDKSVKQFRTYGITTLGKRHITIDSNGKVVFEFVGKSRIKHKKVVVDRELAGQLGELEKLGKGRKLFKYRVDTGEIRPVRPGDLNDYIKSITSNDHSAKDFRTWGASMLAAAELAEIGVTEDDRQLQKNIVKAVKQVAEELGNTPSVCRASYIHPNILKAYSQGIVIDSFKPRRQRHAKLTEDEFDPQEAALIKLFRRFR